MTTTAGPGDVELALGSRDRAARPRGLPARGRLGRADRGAHARRRVLRDAHACSSCCARGHGTHPGRHRAGLAALSRARADARQRPPLLHAGVDQASDPGSSPTSSSTSSTCTSRTTRAFGSRARATRRSCRRHHLTKRQVRDAAGARAALPRARHPGARHARAPAPPRSRRTPSCRCPAHPDQLDITEPAARPLRARPDPRVPASCSAAVTGTRALTSTAAPATSPASSTGSTRLVRRHAAGRCASGTTG